MELKSKAELAKSLDSYVAITDELIANLVSDVEEMETELAWIHELENSGKAIGPFSHSDISVKAVNQHGGRVLIYIVRH